MAKDDFIIEEDVPEHILEQFDLFNSYENNKQLCIQAPSWSVKDPKKMDLNSDNKGWFIYSIEVDGIRKNVYVHCSFLDRFKADEQTALRDIGALPTVTGSYFYTQRENLINNLNHARENPVNEDGSFKRWFIGDPNIDYFIHVDLGLTHDSTGITLAHMDGTFLKDGKYHPKVYVDLVYEMNPKDYGGEIMIHHVRKFICDLRDVYKFGIAHISFDSWQSKDSQQMLTLEGFKTYGISCDRTPFPHQALKEAINLTDPEAGFWAINLYYHEKLIRELSELRNNRKGICDHPAGGCFTGDTKIKLLDGRDLSFIELCKEFKQNEIFYVYSIDKNNNITVGEAYNPRCTKKNAKLLEITLDNNEIIRCTLDHKFMLRDGSYKESKNLEINQSLMPLYTKICMKGLPGYEMFLNPNNQKWKFTHRMVGIWKYPNKKYTGNGKDGIIHHADFIKLNNSPNNLIYCKNAKEHMSYHTINGSGKYITVQDVVDLHNKNLNTKEITKILGCHADTVKSRMKQAFYKGLLKSWKSNFELNRNKQKRKNNKKYKKFIELKNNDTDNILSNREICKILNIREDQIKIFTQKALKENKITKEQSISNHVKKENKNFNDIIELYNQNYYIEDICEILNIDRVYVIRRLREASKKKIINNFNLDDCSKKRLDKLQKLQDMFKNDFNLIEPLLNDFKISEISKILNLKYDRVKYVLRQAEELKLLSDIENKINHKIISIKELDYTEDVYDITVKDHHNFALSSGVFVHNSKDLADSLGGCFFLIQKINDEAINNVIFFDEIPY